MSFILDFNHPVEGFHILDNELYNECEDCGQITNEWDIDQCQYGFCGKFSCHDCGFYCVRCRDVNPRSVTLCRTHSHVAFPYCSECNERFCDECTDVKVRKCTSCQNYICSKCLEKDPSSDGKSFKCGPCSSKLLRPLQEICRNTIRSSIAEVQESTVPGDINKNVENLPLPTSVKNFVCFQ